MVLYARARRVIESSRMTTSRLCSTRRLRLFDHHFGDLNVSGGGLVECRRNYFALHRTLHVRHFFRALVDEQHDEHNFRMIRSDGVGQVLQQHGLAGTRRGDDQAALAFAHGRQQIHDSGAGIFARDFELQPLLRIKRSQVVEENLVARFFGRFEVNGFDLHQREVFFALMRRTNLAADGIAGLQIEFADLRRRHVNVVRTRQVVVIGRAEESVAIGQDFQYAFRKNVALFFALCLKDLKNKVLLAQTAGSGEVQRTSYAG